MNKPDGDNGMKYALLCMHEVASQLMDVQAVERFRDSVLRHLEVETVGDWTDERMAAVANVFNSRISELGGEGSRLTH